MEEAPVFDETKPFESIPIEEAPAFDPNAAFEEVTASNNVKTVETPVEKTKVELVNDEYGIKSLNLDKMLESNPDLKDVLDLAKNKLEQNKKDSLLKAAEIDKKWNEQNLGQILGLDTPSFQAKPEGRDTGIPTTEQQGMEYPTIDPIFGTVGLLGKGAAASVGGDVGAGFGADIFKSITDKMTPELQKENPILYGGLAVLSSLAGGIAGAKGVNLGVEFAPKALDIPTNVLFGKSTEKEALEYIKTRTGETETSLSKMYNSYANATGVAVDSLTDADKIKSILSNSKAGTKIKLDAEYYNTGVLGKLNQSEETLREMFSAASNKGNFEVPALKLKEYLKDSGDLYSSAEKALLDNFKSTTKVKPTDVENLKEVLLGSSMKADDNVVVKRVLDTLEAGNPLSIQDLLVMKRDLNSLNLKSTKAFKAGQVGDLVDTYAKDIIGEDSFGIWKEVNKRYAAKSLIEQDNPIGKMLINLAGRKESLVDVSNKILNIGQKGHLYFNQLREALGDESASMIEKGMIKSMLSSDKNMSNNIANIAKFDFATAEGQSIKQAMIEASSIVSDKDAIKMLNQVTGTTMNSGNVMSSNILEKTKYFLVGKIWNQLLKRTPAGAEERKLTTIGDILKQDNLEFNLDIKKGDKFEEIFKQEQEALRDRIYSLNAKGRARTAQDNKDLLDAKRQEAMLGKEIVPTVINLKAKGTQKIDGELLDADIPKQIGYKNKDDIIDVEATRNYTKGTDDRYFDEFGNMYNNKSEIPSSDTPIPVGIENKSATKKVLDTSKESVVVNKDAYKEDIVQESYAKGFKSSKDVIDEKMKGKEVSTIVNKSTLPIDNEKHIISDIEGYTIKKKNPTMIINGEEINKTDFDKITKLQSNQSNRIGITKEQKILKDKHSRIYDDIKDMDWKPNKVEENSYPTIEDFMTKQELNKARAYAKGSKTSDTKAAYNKWIDSKKKVNQQMDLLGF